jgi:hypothetical protein
LLLAGLVGSHALLLGDLGGPLFVQIRLHIFNLDLATFDVFALQTLVESVLYLAHRTPQKRLHLAE